MNGEPAIAVEQDGRAIAALPLDSDEDRIRACYTVLSPDKLPGS